MVGLRTCPFYFICETSSQLLLLAKKGVYLRLSSGARKWREKRLNCGHAVRQP
jgi:hypothetical protein